MCKGNQFTIAQRIHMSMIPMHGHTT
jgi:hypothetical protein